MAFGGSSDFIMRAAKGFKEKVAAAQAVGTDPGFADRTVVVCCISRSYCGQPSKSLQIQENIKERLQLLSINGKVESVVYPVSTKDVGLPGIVVLDAAVVTFSAKECAESYACLKPGQYVLLREGAKTFNVKEHMTIGSHYTRHFPPGSFQRLVRTMAKYHGIHIKESNGSYVCEGYSFQIKFFKKVMNAVTTPVDSIKLQKYPFQVNEKAESSCLTHLGIPMTHRPHSVPTVQFSRRFDCYLTKTKALEGLEEKYNVSIQVERTFSWACVCRIQGQPSDTQKAVDEIERLKNVTDERIVVFGSTQESQLMAFVRQLDNMHKGTAFYLESGRCLYIMGDEAEECQRKICDHLEDILAGKSKHNPVKHTMVMDPDLLLYLVNFHKLELTSIAQKYNLAIDHEILDGYAQFILKGKMGHEAAETEIAQLAEQCQHQLCTHDVPISTHISKQEVASMNREFQAKKAVIEYDRTRICIHIIASKSNAHQVKDEVTRKFSPKWSSPPATVSTSPASGPTYARGEPKPAGTDALKASRPSFPTKSLGTSLLSGPEVAGISATTPESPIHTHLQSLYVTPRSSSIEIKMMVGDITGLRVDAIVNAATGDMQNTEGVARVIASAAGPYLQQSCDEYVQRHGTLRVTQNAVTSAGSLPVALMIHAVGPDMRNYRQREQECYNDVEETIQNILRTAQEKRIRSIAMPPISSGIFGVPIDEVAKRMAKAVTEFLQNEDTQLREVIIVDTSDTNITIIQREFNKKKAATGSPVPGGASVRGNPRAPSPDPDLPAFYVPPCA